MRGSRSIKKHGDLFSLEAAATLNQVDISFIRGAAAASSMRDHQTIPQIKCQLLISNNSIVVFMEYYYHYERYNENLSDAFLWNALQSFFCFTAYPL
jgi:hypothetical protein